MPNAEVRLYRFGEGSFAFREFTAGGGIVEFDGVEPGDYDLEVIAQGYETDKERIDLSPGTSQSFTASLNPISNENSNNKPGGLVSAGSLAAPAPARKELDAGVAEMEKQNAAGGAQHFHKAIEVYPKFAEAYAWLGAAYMQTKQPADAQAAASKAIELDPKLSMAHTVLGKLYLDDRKYSQAESELLASIQLSPQAWDAPFELARCYFNMGRMDKALDYARRAEAAPSAPPVTHLLLVDIYLRKNDKGNALSELQSFAKQAPQSPLLPRVQRKIDELSKPAGAGRQN